METLMTTKHDCVHYLMPPTKQGLDFKKFVKIFETDEVFGLEVITMRYVAAGVFVFMELFFAVAIE